jgi:hypothetical protein
MVTVQDHSRLYGSERRTYLFPMLRALPKTSFTSDSPTELVRADRTEQQRGLLFDSVVAK